MTPPPGPAAPDRPTPPAPLLVAASLVAVEAAVLVLLGVAELWSLSGARLVMGATTALFFVGYGVALAFCAWALRRLAGWSRAPVVLTQLIALGLAWNFRADDTTPVAVALAVVAAMTLVGLLHPASTAALQDE